MPKSDIFMEIDKLKPIFLRSEPLSIKEAESMYLDIKTAVNKEDKNEARFVRNGFAKNAQHRSRTQFLKLIPELKYIFESAIPIYKENEKLMPGHKRHPNILAYHNYLNVVVLDGDKYYVRLTLQELRTKAETRKKGYVPFELHNVFVSNKNEIDEYLSGFIFNPAINLTNLKFLDQKLIEWFQKVRLVGKGIDIRSNRQEIDNSNQLFLFGKGVDIKPKAIQFFN